MQATLTRPSGPNGPGTKTTIGYSSGRCIERFYAVDANTQCIFDVGHEGLHETEKGLRWK